MGGATYTAVTALAGLGSLAALVWVEFYAAPAAGEPAGWAGLLGDLQQPSVAGPRVVALVLLGGYIWWRSLRGDAPALGAIYTRFERIIVAFLGYALITWVAAAAFMQPVFTRDLFLVFLVALWAFALARSRMEGARSHQQLSTRWFVFSLGLIAAILAGGMLVAGAVRRQCVRRPLRAALDRRAVDRRARRGYRRGDCLRHRDAAGGYLRLPARPAARPGDAHADPRPRRRRHPSTGCANRRPAAPWPIPPCSP